MANDNKPKPKMGFTILRDDPIDGHKGFGRSSLSLENVSPVIVDVDEGTAQVEMGAMHARSLTERGIKFTVNREDSEGGKPYWLVWVTIDYKEDGPYYAGVTAAEMVINREKRRGYKVLADHVNLLDKSIKRKIIVDGMDDRAKEILADFLKSHNEELWRNSSPELFESLNVAE
ncbi:YwhD family protein [Bhargavaea ullalensis]|uniref:YwhD family protein n=1 Tax=Bhargavaea ullalensis TaxID=1265685 RepID=A0ABV2GBS0_9BACL